MTIDEAIKLANEGNAEAMMSLGGHYFGENEFDEAEKWYTMAANKGVTLAAYLNMTISVLSGRIRQVHGAWQEIIEINNRLLHWASVVLNDNDFDYANYEINKDEIYNDIFEAYYNIAHALYWSENYTDSINYLKKIGENCLQYQKSRVLMGICYGELARINIGNKNYAEAEELFKTVVNILSIVNPNSNYIPNKNEYHEQMVFAKAAFCLTMAYVNGIGTPVKNIDYAHDILESALSKVTEDDAKNVIQSRLSHFQKKMFGGYKYI